MKRALIVASILAALIAFLVPSVSAPASGQLAYAPRIHVKDSTSSNWSGYAVQYPSLAYPQNGVVTDVKGTWTVPSVSTSTPTAYSAIWVGIDGYSSSSVEQIGTEQDSNGIYYAWYEMYPKGSYVIGSVPITAGNVITAEVRYVGNSNFTLTITNATTGKSFSTTQKSGKTQRSSAEWVVEAPWWGGVLPLANFGTVNFSGASFNNPGLPITAWQYDPMTMVDPSGGKATPSGLTNGGTAFSVTYSAN